MSVLVFSEIPGNKANYLLIVELTFLYEIVPMG